MDILDLNDKVLVEAYKGNNYQCFDTNVDSDLCYIMFSSNGLYFPNTREIFEQEILKKDRYEWKWVVQNSNIPQLAGRIIYIRDIYKCWYTKGINERDNTIDKTIKRIEKLTEGYRIVTVGSSAGGYMAVLTAIKLNAEYCFNFSGQYFISNQIGNPYYDLTDLVKNYNGEIYYFFPLHCQGDKENYERVKGIQSVKAFQFDNSKHAETMLTGNMCYIVDKTQRGMQTLFRKFENRRINKFVFLLRTVPTYKIFGIIWKETQGFLVRLRGKHWTGV